LNPLTTLLRLILHYIVLILLIIIMEVLTIVAWFSILITGRYPRGLFKFEVGIQRWGYRVYSYGWMLRPIALRRSLWSNVARR
jgi:hypothetical protein